MNSSPAAEAWAVVAASSTRSAWQQAVRAGAPPQQAAVAAVGQRLELEQVINPLNGGAVAPPMLSTIRNRSPSP